MPSPTWLRDAAFGATGLVGVLINHPIPDAEENCRNAKYATVDMLLFLLLYYNLASIIAIENR